MFNKLIKARKSKKITQQVISENLGISKSTYCRKERGEIVMTRDEIMAIKNLMCLTNNEVLDIFFSN